MKGREKGGDKSGKSWRRRSLTRLYHTFSKTDKKETWQLFLAALFHVEFVSVVLCNVFLYMH